LYRHDWQVNTIDVPTKLVRQDTILGGLSIGQFGNYWIWGHKRNYTHPVWSIIGSQLYTPGVIYYWFQLKYGLIPYIKPGTQSGEGRTVFPDAKHFERSSNVYCIDIIASTGPTKPDIDTFMSRVFISNDFA